jgi:hypothetical protein
MVFISITRLRVKSVYYLLPFMLANESSVKQLHKTKGFLGGSELIDKGRTYWTVTLWRDDADMKVFRSSAAHRKAMQKLPVWCDEASYLHWMQDECKQPDWKTIAQKMLAEGKISKVRNPSVNQVSMAYPEIKWTRFERKFKPGMVSI